MVADHERLWAKHQTISDPSHVAAAKRCAASRWTWLRPTARDRGRDRRLADYDTALGLADDPHGVA